MEGKKQCLICQEKVATQPVEMHRKYSIYQCPNCGLQFVDPIEYNPRDYDKAYKGQDTEYIEVDYSCSMNIMPYALGDIKWFMLPPDARWVLRWLRMNLHPSSPVLDLGCGSGKFMAALREAGFLPFGIDPAIRPIEILRRQGFKVVVGSSIRDYPSDWPEPSAIVMLRVLAHLPNPLGYLETIFACFPRASLLVSVPSPKRWVFRKRKDTRGGPPNHYTRWTARCLSLALEQAGYSTSEVIFPPVTPDADLTNCLEELIKRLLRSRIKTGRVFPRHVGHSPGNLPNSGDPLKWKLFLQAWKVSAHIKSVLGDPLARYLTWKGYRSKLMIGFGISKEAKRNG